MFRLESLSFRGDEFGDTAIVLNTIFGGVVKYTNVISADNIRAIAFITDSKLGVAIRTRNHSCSILVFIVVFLVVARFCEENSIAWPYCLGGTNLHRDLIQTKLLPRRLHRFRHRASRHPHWHSQHNFVHRPWSSELWKERGQWKLSTFNLAHDDWWRVSHKHSVNFCKKATRWSSLKRKSQLDWEPSSAWWFQVSDNILCEKRWFMSCVIWCANRSPASFSAVSQYWKMVPLGLIMLAITIPWLLKLSVFVSHE